jgi:hypothetical protein
MPEGNASTHVISHYYMQGSGRHTYSTLNAIQFSHEVSELAPFEPGVAFEEHPELILEKDPPWGTGLALANRAILGDYRIFSEDTLQLGLYVSDFDPLSRQSLSWKATYSNSHKFPERITGYSIAAGHHQDKDVLFLAGGKDGQTYSTRTYVLKQDDQSQKMVWHELNADAILQCVAPTLYVDAERERLFAFGGKDWDGNYLETIQTLDLKSTSPIWTRYEPAKPVDRPRFAGAKVTASRSGKYLYFHGGTWLDSMGNEEPMPVILYNRSTEEWVQIAFDLEANLPTCGDVVADGSRLLYFQAYNADASETLGLSGRIYSYTPAVGDVDYRDISRDEMGDMQGGCHLVYVKERRDILIFGKDKLAQPTESEVHIDPDTLEIIEDDVNHAPCSEPGEANREGMQCTSDDKWWRHPGRLACDPESDSLYCDADAVDSKWYGSYFALSPVNKAVLHDGVAYLATNLGLQIVILKIPYVPVFAGWAYSNGPANDLAVDHDKIVYVADGNGIRIYDADFSLTPILRDRVELGQPVRALQLVDDRVLYAITDHSAYAFDVSDPRNVSEISSIGMNDPELTDISFGDPFVYLSGQRGIYGVDLRANPAEQIMEMVTPSVVHHLYSDGSYIYTVDERAANQAYLLYDPVNPDPVGDHSVSGLVNGVSRDDNGRSARANGWWLDLRKLR